MSGCIPVFFAFETPPADRCSEGVIAPHFASFHKFAVFVPRDAFLAGNATIAEVLGRLSAARVREMQRELARQAPRLLYPLLSKEEEGGKKTMRIRNTAPEVLLRALLKHSIEPARMHPSDPARGREKAVEPAWVCNATADP